MSDQADVLVELDGVTKEFGDLTAVEGIDFTIHRGEFFTLVGPSGCGKTTTLRMISGFEQPTRGEVRIDDRPIAAIPPEARDTNLVFQQLSRSRTCPSARTRLRPAEGGRRHRDASLARL